VADGDHGLALGRRRGGGLGARVPDAPGPRPLLLRLSRAGFGSRPAVGELRVPAERRRVRRRYRLGGQRSRSGRAAARPGRDADPPAPHGNRGRRPVAEEPAVHERSAPRVLPDRLRRDAPRRSQRAAAGRDARLAVARRGGAGNSRRGRLQARAARGPSVRAEPDDHRSVRPRHDQPRARRPGRPGPERGPDSAPDARGVGRPARARHRDRLDGDDTGRADHADRADHAIYAGRQRWWSRGPAALVFTRFRRCSRCSDDHDRSRDVGQAQERRRDRGARLSRAPHPDRGPCARQPFQQHADAVADQQYRYLRPVRDVHGPLHRSRHGPRHGSRDDDPGAHPGRRSAGDGRILLLRLRHEYDSWSRRPARPAPSRWSRSSTGAPI